MATRVDGRDDRAAYVPRAVAVAGAYAWRVVAVAGACWAVAWLLTQLRFVILALLVALLVVELLHVPVRWLRARGMPPALAAATGMVVFLSALAGGLALLGAAVADGVPGIGDTTTRAVDDLERWLVEDSPFALSAEDVQRLRTDAGDAVHDFVTSADGLAGAMAVAETALAILVGLVVAFFGLKDGGRFVAWVGSLLPEARRPLAARMGDAAWHTVAGYLKGAATLGVVEGAIVAVTLTAVGADLAVPVALLTFLAAFVPFVGAIAAGLLAVLVALATSGTTAALVVAAVMLAVQQFDNEVLAPVVYGRALSLHPVVVLLSVAAGSALFGIAGTLLAVPVTAVAVATAREARLTPKG